MNSLDACPPPRELQPGKPVDAEWLQWIAENRLRNCTPESMLETMVAAGVDRSEAAAAIARMETDPAYLATRVFLAGPYAAETDLTTTAAIHHPDHAFWSGGGIGSRSRGTSSSDCPRSAISPRPSRAGCRTPPPPSTRPPWPRCCAPRTCPPSGDWLQPVAGAAS